LRACLSACRGYGIEVHAWKLCFNLGDNPPASLVRRFAEEGRLQATRSGATRNWLCPSHAANRRLEARAAEELLQGYPDLAGVHLDFIRFPGSSTCFCEACRRGFTAYVGRPIGAWPGAVRAEGPLHPRWLAYRRAMISDTVRQVAAAVRSVRPAARVSAAVFSDAASARDSVGQDWPTWARSGWVDFVCPMNYHDEAAALKSDVARQVPLVAGTGTRLFPGIGLSTGRLDVLEALRQINVTRSARTGGFVLFEYGLREALEVLPGLSPALRRDARRP
jgi:uncharacterized lipoprotein YddW (UPF0748 family)